MSKQFTSRRIGADREADRPRGVPKRDSLSSKTLDVAARPQGSGKETAFSGDSVPERRVMSDQPKLVLFLTEASALLGLKPSQLYEYTRHRARARMRHPVPSFYLGRRLAFRRQALEAWVSKLETEGSKQ